MFETVPDDSRETLGAHRRRGPIEEKKQTLIMKTAFMIHGIRFSYASRPEIDGINGWRGQFFQTGAVRLVFLMPRLISKRKIKLI